MSGIKESAERPKMGRLPAPSLFVGPPSRNASSLSIATAPKEAQATGRQPLNRQRSILGQEVQRSDKATSPATPIDALNLGSFSRRPPMQALKSEQLNNERTDALWAEMQNTLEEVELSASSGTHVFGPAHSRVLEELRAAQIKLAQEWAKSEAEDDLPDSASSKASTGKPHATADILSAERRAKMSHSEGSEGRTQLEEDTQNDIALARKRREANDRYFQRVNKGVLDVVGKLEDVARAMKDVEMESKEIWGDRDSVDTASIT